MGEDVKDSHQGLLEVVVKTAKAGLARFKLFLSHLQLLVHGESWF